MEFHFFSKQEEPYYLRLRAWKDRLLQPICRYLSQHRVKPDNLSYASLAMVAPFLYFFRFHPWLAMIFLVLNIFFDILDGALARFTHKETARGEFLDHIVADYVSFFIIFLSFVYYGLVNPFWGAVYVLNYAVMLSMIFYCNYRHIKFFPIARSKYVVYMAFFLWLLTANNFLDITVVFFSVYMIVTNIILLNRVRCSLS